jgi:hypothetical protein
VVFSSSTASVFCNYINFLSVPDMFLDVEEGRASVLLCLFLFFSIVFICCCHYKKMSEEESNGSEHGDIAGDDQEYLEELSDQGDGEAHEGDDSDDGTWPDRETVRVIELFRSHPQLYDVTHKWYCNREKKAGTLALMAKELKCTGKF